MNASRLLEHFDRISEAPDAIPKLRKFILDLAVRGKLVEHNSTDEPAGALLARIRTEKARLAKTGATKKSKPTTPPPAAEIPFAIPANWEWSQLAEIGLISPRNSAPDSEATSFVPMKLIPAEFGLDATHEVRPWGEIKSGFTHFANGDVALAKITPCFENGKSTVFKELTGGIGAGTTELHVVRPILVSADYLLVFLKSPYFIETGIPKMTGTAGQKRVSTEYFSQAPLPLPPLAEQHRIVAKVDELIGLCDRLEAARAERETRRDRVVAASVGRVAQQLDRDGSFNRHEIADFCLTNLKQATQRQVDIEAIRQTVLSLAVNGRLVPQDPLDESGEQLLCRVGSAKVAFTNEGMIRKEKPLPAISENSVPFQIPPTWAWARIGDCALRTEYGTSVKSVNTVDGVPVLKMGDIQSGRVSSRTQSRVPRNIEDLPGLFLKRFDLLYNRTNSAELVGKTGIFTGEDDTVTFASYLIRIQFINDLINPAYVNLAMNAPYFRPTQIVPELTQQCGQANVNGAKLRSMLIPLPPLSEQHRIVAKVDELMTVCDRLEARLTTAQAESRQLLHALLSEALAVSATEFLSSSSR